METVISSPVLFTPTAIHEINRLMNDASFDVSKKLRLGVKGGGCSGLSYVLGFDEEQKDDESFEVEGIPVLMQKAHGIYLYGMQVDWENGLNNRGFIFTNPNASSTCGCGTSFAV